MHELSVATQVVDLAVDRANAHDAETVDRLTVAVGRATHLNPEQLRFCIRTVAEGTSIEGAAIAVERVQPRARCDCGWRGEPDAVEDAAAYVPDPVCPECGGRVELTRGRGCRLASIDIPDPAEPTETRPRQQE